VQVDELVFLPHEYLLLTDDHEEPSTVFLCRHTFESRLRRNNANTVSAGRGTNTLFVGMVTFLLAYT